MAFSSSLVTYGRGKGIVTDIGMDTEVGKIADMINSAEENVTPLQVKLNNLGKILRNRSCGNLRCYIYSWYDLWK